MPEVFVISDTHFGHKNILKFPSSYIEGEKLRPFKSLTEMNVTIIENWNKVVSVKDKVYHLGDVAWDLASLKLVGLLNGKKKLVRGNHDLLSLASYREFFHDVYGVRQINGIWLTHCPMYLGEDVDKSRVKINLHGHLHDRIIPNKKYKNVCVECINYTPISLDEIIKEL